MEEVQGSNPCSSTSSDQDFRKQKDNLVDQKPPQSPVEVLSKSERPGLEEDPGQDFSPPRERGSATEAAILLGGSSLAVTPVRSRASPWTVRNASWPRRHGWRGRQASSGC